MAGDRQLFQSESWRNPLPVAILLPRIDSQWSRPAPSVPPFQAKSIAIKVTVRSNESLEAALRRFKRQCNFGGTFKAAKANSFHEKRSDERRRERRERLRTIQKATRKNDPNRRVRRQRS